MKDQEAVGQRRGFLGAELLCCCVCRQNTEAQKSVPPSSLTKRNKTKPHYKYGRA